MGLRCCLEFDVLDLCLYVSTPWVTQTTVQDMRAEDLGILSYELEWEYDLSRDLLYACTFQDKYSKTVDLQTAVSRLQKK